MSSCVHDIGGLEEEFGPIDRREWGYLQWEMQVHAVLVVLTRKGLMSTDELRRAMENLPGHSDMTYYHRWAAGMIAVSVERGTFSLQDVELCEGGLAEPALEPQFQVGETVRVRREEARVRWRKPHLRTPGYLFGTVGIVERILGSFPNPEYAAFKFGGNISSAQQPLYLVSFSQGDLWECLSSESKRDDRVTAEIYQPWLQREGQEETVREKNVVVAVSAQSRVLDHGDHSHDDRYDTEVEAIRREMTAEDPLGQRMAETLLQVLINNNILNILEVNGVIEKLDNAGKMLGGQKLVVKAWTDEDFKRRLLADGNAAAEEIGIVASNANAPTKFVVVENTEAEHHLIVCTLCSCYPSAVLGMAPAWYKSRSYRARGIREPRKVLREFGCEVGAEQRVTVHDSTADCRYMVLPRRPENTQGWTEEQLSSIISRDSLIGVAVPTLLNTN